MCCDCQVWHIHRGLDTISRRVRRYNSHEQLGVLDIQSYMYFEMKRDNGFRRFTSLFMQIAVGGGVSA